MESKIRDLAENAKYSLSEAMRQYPAAFGIVTLIAIMGVVTKFALSDSDFTAWGDLGMYKNVAKELGIFAGQFNP